MFTIEFYFTLLKKIDKGKHDKMFYNTHIMIKKLKELIRRL